MKNCIVCNIKTNKYKCPKCLEPYCSLDCFKNHKITTCEIKTNNSNLTNDNKIEDDNKPQNTILFPTIHTVPLEKLEELRNSDNLKQLLHNQHLRKFLLDIDNSDNAWKTMAVAMMEPLFLEFADDCLKIVEPVAESDY